VKFTTPGNWRVRESQLFLALTVVIGIIAGLLAVLFALSIDVARHLLLGQDPPWWRLAAIPCVVAIFTGILLAYVFPDVRGSGVPQTKAAFFLHRGIIRPRVAFGKFLTGVLCIGSGHSMGREGPSVQIGAAIASWAGQWLHLPRERIRDLVPVGASAALAAAFNTPMAAVLFSLEEIIADMNAPLIGSTVLASVAAVVVERAILGNEPLFHVPQYRLMHPGELVVYAILGILGGIASVAFARGLLVTRKFFLDLPSKSRVIQPAIGGLIIGLTLIVLPEVSGVGYEYVDQALNGGLVIRMMLILLVAKMAATIVSYASGNAGGIFAPTLYFGAMLGGAVGLVARLVAPFPVAAPGAYALVGMGALFAGIIRAPMTSVFMIFEITQDYQILVPLMVANMLSLAISRRYQPDPVYHALLEQDGVHLPPALAHRGIGEADLAEPPLNPS
jgi:chloride channel protein, CIC family